MSKTFVAAAAIAATLGISGSAVAQLPPGVFAGQPDFHLAAKGAYDIDPTHTAIIAKVSHIGYSLSIFRFEKVTGTLTWDPATPASSKLSVKIEPGSIATPVKGFAEELSGAGYLNTAKYPEATFVSTAFHQTDALHGKVDGKFTLMGKTVPLTFDVTLLGAGKGFLGHPRIGVEAVAHISPTDFGLPAILGKSIELVIDTEMGRQ